MLHCFTDDKNYFIKMCIHFKYHPTVFNPLMLNDLKRCCAVSPLKIKIPSKNMCEKPTNAPMIHSVYELCMVFPTCFSIALPSSGTVPSAF
jgi:hypothetical protein